MYSSNNGVKETYALFIKTDVSTATTEMQYILMC